MNDKPKFEIGDEVYVDDINRFGKVTKVVLRSNYHYEVTLPDGNQLWSTEANLTYAG